MSELEPVIPDNLLDKVRRKEMANLIKKVSDGGTLTAAQWARVLEFTSNRNKEAPGTATVSTISDLCAAIGISRPTFYLLRRRFPAEYPKRKPNGDWSVPEWRVFATMKGYGDGSGVPDEDERYGLEMSLLKIKCRTAAIEYYRTASEYTRWDDVERVLGHALSTIRSRLLSIPASISKLCEGKRASEIFSEMDRAIREALSVAENIKRPDPT